MIQISTWKIIAFSRCEVIADKLVKGFTLQFPASMLGSKVQLANVCGKA